MRLAPPSAPEAWAKSNERATRSSTGTSPSKSFRRPSRLTKSVSLELVEGPTLAERIAQGPIPLEEDVAIARQIADALEAGHEAGVVHRDLKPANVKVEEDGTVKVLDYGLAKALEDEATGASSELSQSPTLTRQGTQIGVILGTAAYMSPEQAKGKRFDERSDIFSFGCLLYEMLTGRKAFDGETVAETLAAVIKTEPEWKGLPADLRPIVVRCLDKDPRKRYRDIGDVRSISMHRSPRRAWRPARCRPGGSNRLPQRPRSSRLDRPYCRSTPDRSRSRRVSRGSSS